ncbi:glycosyl-transferase for dystroglycan-domain-containing protein [Halteromyces radiatus]|uniref:glycosyl-transferase for dystroglycan-domain-containing protein n=1 Tax=Halteromyces radiatus TaxID=101107 RepID=UPI00221FFD91|nr:glycosyl-transferase for dystroglycan-domain-containing protein [Halteromyces radiatus]KAI8078632.1 glycosyl-transferase for dystroglycan-domain-containing protein [Halteromyces radiatus]
MSFEHSISYRKVAKTLVIVCFLGLFIGWFIDLSSLDWKQHSTEFSILWTPPTTTTTTFTDTNQITLTSDRFTMNKNQFNWIDNRNGQQHQLPTKSVFEKAFSASVGNSDIQPYYFKANHHPTINDITILTTITKSRIHTLAILAERYQGPISVALHIAPDESGENTLELLGQTIKQQPSMQKYVDVHVIKDKMERQLNLWRNVARFFARSDNVMMLDVDFYLCTDFRKHILNNPHAMELLNNGHSALVIPAFEFTKQDDGLDYRTFPTTKHSLINLYQNQAIDMFHSFWTPGHASTNYPYWITANDIYKVTEYQQSYEPYIVYKKNHQPWCDERFFGYGSNKAACLFELYVSGVDYYVMPQDFIIHQTHDYPNETRSLERFYNRRLYNQFREEICLRYARMFVAQDEWETPKSFNLIEQCNRLPRFQSTVKTFL